MEEPGEQWRVAGATPPGGGVCRCCPSQTFPSEHWLDIVGVCAGFALETLVYCVVRGTICSSDSAVYRMKWGQQIWFISRHREGGGSSRYGCGHLGGTCSCATLTWEVLGKSLLHRDCLFTGISFPFKGIKKKKATRNKFSGHHLMWGWISGSDRGFCVEEEEENVWAPLSFWNWNKDLSLFCI